MQSLSGKECVIIGRLRSMNKEQAKIAIFERGGINISTVRDSADIVVKGIGYGKKLLAARKTNALILEEAEFLALLEGQALEGIVEDREQTPEVKLQDAFSSFRQALSPGPTREAWEQLLVLLDATSDSELPTIVEYLCAHMEGWDSQPHESWTEPENTDIAAASPFWKTQPRPSWGLHMEAGEVRVAPYHWIEQMLQGVDSPKWLLVRQLHLQGLGLNGKHALKLLSHPSLRKVEILGLSWNEKLSTKFFKALRGLENLKHLKSLRLGKTEPKKIAGLKGEAVFSIRRLGLDLNPRMDSESMKSILEAECFQSLESLEIMGGWPATVWAEEMQERPEAFPRLTRFRQLCSRPVECFEALLQSGVTARLQTLEIGCTTDGLGLLPLTREALFELLQVTHFPQLTRLDVHSMYAQVYQGPSQEEVREWLLEALKASGLLPQLETLVLGDLGTEEWKQSLASSSMKVL